MTDDDNALDVLEVGHCAVPPSESLRVLPAMAQPAPRLATLFVAVVLQPRGIALLASLSATCAGAEIAALAPDLRFLR